jgi:hypothetical protein
MATEYGTLWGVEEPFPWSSSFHQRFTWWHAVDDPRGEKCGVGCRIFE